MSSSLIEYNKLDDAIANICGSVEMAQFSTCYYSKDQLDKIIYDPNEIITTRIKGGRCFYFYPYGTIRHTKENYYRLDCANLYFMISRNAIPIEMTNIPEICNISRSDGRVHGAQIIENQSLYFNTNRNCFVINVDFNNETHDKVEPKKIDIKNLDNKNNIISGDIFSKAMPLNEFMNINKMDVLEINLKTINLDDYNFEDEDPIRNEIITYFNNELKNWTSDVLIVMLKEQNIKFLITLDDKQL